MQELTIAEAETIALSILKQVMEEKVQYLKPLHFPHSPGSTHRWLSCNLVHNR
jgi:hypothetical protein